jgi:rhodanese-related sulfurtransferase
MARYYRSLAIAPLSILARGRDNGVTITYRRNAMSYVSEVAAAPATAAQAHFEAQLEFETDCWDVHHALAHEHAHGEDFVLLDVRSAELFAAGHIPGAVHLPHGKIVPAKLAGYPADTLFIAYCAGPHCNGAARAAIRLARLSRPVKIMAGGVTGWIDEGFILERA